MPTSTSGDAYMRMAAEARRQEEARKAKEAQEAAEKAGRNYPKPGSPEYITWLSGLAPVTGKPVPGYNPQLDKPPAVEIPGPDKPPTVELPKAETIPAERPPEPAGPASPSGNKVAWLRNNPPPSPDIDPRGYAAWVASNPFATQSDKAQASLIRKFNYQVPMDVKPEKIEQTYMPSLKEVADLRDEPQYEGMSDAEIQKRAGIERLDRQGLLQSAGHSPISHVFTGIDDKGKYKEVKVSADEYWDVMNKKPADRLEDFIDLGVLPEGTELITDVKTFNKKFGMQISPDSPYATPDIREYVNYIVKYEGAVALLDKNDLATVKGEKVDIDLEAFEAAVKNKAVMSALVDLGYEKKDIEKRADDIIEFKESLKETPRLMEAYEKGGYAGVEKESASMQAEWEKEVLPVLPENIQREYKKAKKTGDYSKVDKMISGLIADRGMSQQEYRDYLTQLAQQRNYQAGYDAVVKELKDKGFETSQTVFIPTVGYVTVPGYDIAGALRKGISQNRLLYVFPPDVIEAAIEFNTEMGRAARAEELYQEGRDTWVNMHPLKDGSPAYSVRLTSQELREKYGHSIEVDKFVKDRPALILPADPAWSALKNRPADDPERQAYLRRWHDTVTEAVTFASFAALPYTMGGIGAVGRLLTIPKVGGNIALRATGVVINPVVKAGTALAKLANLWPVPAMASVVTDDIRTTQLQADWQKFENLSEAQKDKWAEKAGYPGDFDKLTDEQKSVVLLHYSPPEGTSREKWLGTIGEKIEDLNEYASSGADWLKDRTPTAISAPVTFLGGAAAGVLEGMGYVASIPLVAGNIVAAAPAGKAAAVGKDVVKGMAEFFTLVLPAALKANPALASGRITGLFVLSPAAMLKLGRSGLARFKLRYTPERGMASDYTTVRIRFDKAGEFLKLSEKERMRITEKAIKELLEGKKEVSIAGAKATITLKNVPYQQAVGNSLWHFTTDIRAFGKGQVPARAELFTSPQAALRFGVMSSKGKPGTHVGLVEIRVPEQYRPNMIKLGRSGEAELESVFGKGTVLEQIPGWTGKGVSSNVITGPYPIRRFTVLGSKTAVGKLTPLKLTQIRLAAARAAFGDLVKGWSGRREAIAGMFRPDPRIKNIDKAIAKLKDAKPELLAETGEIIRRRDPVPHPSGKGEIKHRVTAVVRNSRGEIMLVKDVTEQSFGLPGGQIDVKWRPGQLGFRRLPDGRRVLAPEGAAHGQVKSEVGIGLDHTRYLDTYMGKMNEYALSGSRIFEAMAKSDRFKLKKTEIQDALWWDGKSEITVYPASYDILRGLAKRYGLDMSKVRIDNTSSILNRARDTAIVKRLETGNPLPKTIDPVKLNKIEIAHLKKQKAEISRGETPSLTDWITAEGELRTSAELLHGRRNAASIKPSDPLRSELNDALLSSLRKDTSRQAGRARRLLEEGKIQESIRAYEKDIPVSKRQSIFEDLYKRKDTEARAALEDIYERYGRDIYRQDSFARSYAYYLGRYAAAAIANRPLSTVRSDRKATSTFVPTKIPLAPAPEIDKEARDIRTPPVRTIYEDMVFNPDRTVTERSSTPPRTDIPTTPVTPPRTPEPPKQPPPPETPTTPEPPRPPEKPGRTTPPRETPTKKTTPSKDGTAPPIEEWTDEEITSAIAWKQGAVVHALRAPYKTQADVTTFHESRLPDKLKVLKPYSGTGSPAASVRTFTKRPPKDLDVDMGVQDVLIRRKGNRGIQLRFRPDPRRQTIGNLSVSKPKNISKKRGRVYHTKIGGSTVISRRPIRGR